MRMPVRRVVAEAARKSRKPSARDHAHHDGQRGDAEQQH
jgi:hypothetical protein